MPELGRREYYPWYENSSANFPNDRYLNRDFLRFEQQRIEDAKEWNEEYRKADRGDKLDEYITYVIPVEISKILGKELDEQGYHVMGTSAVRNSAQLPKLALIPEDLKIPADYSLIRIEEPVKEVVRFKGDVYGSDAIIVNDWDPLPIDYVYQGLESDAGDIFSILEECLGGDDLMARSVHAPMVSAPRTGTEVGGIGSCSLTPTTRFGDTLHRQVGRMLPPEYTDYTPPERDVKGFNERYSKGRGRKIVYQTAENVPRAESYVGFGNGTSYSKVQHQAEMRAEFRGEYSYLGNVAPSDGRSHHVVQEALDKFTQNEITVSSYEHLKQADVDLTQLDNLVGDYEDIWIGIVDARQVMPDVGDYRVDREKWVSELRDDWGRYLPRMGYNDLSPVVPQTRAEQTFKNILRVAQQFARSDKREQITERDFKDAHWNFKAQADRLLDTDVVKDAAREIEKDASTDEEELVHMVLKSKPCTWDELVSRLLETRQFENRETTENFLERMWEYGYIYRTPDGKFHTA